MIKFQVFEREHFLYSHSSWTSGGCVGNVLAAQLPTACVDVCVDTFTHTRTGHRDALNLGLMMGWGGGGGEGH